MNSTGSAGGKSISLALLIGLAGVVVAILAWIHPFSPVGPAPLTTPQTPEPHLTDVGVTAIVPAASGPEFEHTAAQPTSTLRAPQATALQGAVSIPHETPPLATIPTVPTTDTPEPVIKVVSVWAFEENGVRFSIDKTGIYRIAYWGDAYSPWPNSHYEGYLGWTTIVRIYVNRSVEWGKTEYGLTSPVNEDVYVGPGGYFLDKNQAIAISAGDSRTFRFSAGDYLLLVTHDERGRYTDNQGKVDVGIVYLGQ